MGISLIVIVVTCLGSGERAYSFQYYRPVGRQSDSIINRVRMLGMDVNGISKDGPCLAMTYFGIAQSYTGKLLTLNEIKKMLADPLVYIHEGEKKGAKEADYIIKKAIKILSPETDVSKLKITAETESNIVDPGAFATVLKIDAKNISSSGHHFQQGSNTGELIWDPFYGTEKKDYKYIEEIRNIYIERIE